METILELLPQWKLNAASSKVPAGKSPPDISGAVDESQVPPTVEISEKVLEQIMEMECSEFEGSCR